MNCYRLQRYIYKNGSIYEILWGPFKKKILSGPYSLKDGICKVNELCGIMESKPDYFHLKPVIATNKLMGTFLVNFKDPETGVGNDPFPAKIEPYKKRLAISWKNGRSAVIDAKHINVWELEN